MYEKIKVGFIGCGSISPAYFRGCGAFRILDLTACADLDLDRARARAEEFGIARACRVPELLDDPEIRIVVNLTVPRAHAQVNQAILQAGKNVYCEKPLAVSRSDGLAAVRSAEEKGLLIGAAPDTFLGGGGQTCRKLIDEGAIGEPVAGTAFMMSHGHESWHPAPEFYYQLGGGPMFDMGPYYLTALINLLGPVRRVTGSARISFPERVITSEPQKGKRIQVETPTHIAGVMDFACGAVVTIITSFDIWAADLPHIEIYGADGSLAVPDPNSFGGPVRLRRAGDEQWTQVPLTHSAEVSRGIGVADMAYALAYGRPHRANGTVAYHVLEVMHAFEESSRTGRHIEIAGTCPRPAPLPTGLPPGELDH